MAPSTTVAPILKIQICYDTSKKLAEKVLRRPEEASECFKLCLKMANEIHMINKKYILPSWIDSYLEEIKRLFRIIEKHYIAILNIISADKLIIKADRRMEKTWPCERCFSCHIMGKLSKCVKTAREFVLFYPMKMQKCLLLVDSLQKCLIEPHRQCFTSVYVINNYLLAIKYYSMT